MDREGAEPVQPTGTVSPIGPRTLFRVPVFIATIGALAITLVGRAAAGTWPFALVTNFPVQLLIAGVTLTALALLLRARLTALVAVACVVLNGLPVVSTLTQDARPARAGAPRITIGHLNAQTRPIDVPALGRYLATQHPSIFVVLDPAQADVSRLTNVAPGYMVYRTGAHVTMNPEFVRTVVLSRIHLGRVRHPDDPDFGASAVDIEVDRAPVLSIVAFGTDSPTTSGRAGKRDQALHAAAKWSRAHSGRRVVMGDFNTTPWSSSFRRLLHDGRLFDSLSGFGLQVSWPESNVLLRIPIDHAVLGPALAATARGTGPSFGSQHRSLHVTVTERDRP